MTKTPLFDNPRINFLLLMDITIIVYLAVFISGFSSLDDYGLIEDLQKKQLTFSSLVSSGGSTYLRPLTILTYLFDYHVWGANAAAFHGTNLLIHIANTCLVYQLCRTYMSQSESREGISFFVALFFAISPLNSESVLWVSGRTDILCGFFFIVALIILLDNRLSLLRAGVGFSTAFFCSLLAKESSFALLGIVPLYLFFTRNCKSRQEKFALCGATVVTSLLYLYMRLGPKGQLDSGTTKIVAKVLEQTLFDLIFKIIATFGFYVKKLLWPHPLNLAIQSINEPLYFSVGIVAFIAIGICFYRVAATRLPLLIITLGLVPPLLAFQGSIPWTLYAERYLYMPMVGMSLLIGLLLSHLARIPQILAFLLVIPLGLSTIHRSGQWADPVILWQDTAGKSPHFAPAHVTYAYELIQIGRIIEAEDRIQLIKKNGFENELLSKCEKSIKTVNQIHDKK